jgi:predicted small lipoprotein YifL
MRDNRLGILHLVIIAVLAFSFFGCGKKGNPKYVAKLEILR